MPRSNAICLLSSPNDAAHPMICVGVSIASAAVAAGVGLSCTVGSILSSSCPDRTLTRIRLDSFAPYVAGHTPDQVIYARCGREPVQQLQAPSRDRRRYDGANDKGEAPVKRATSGRPRLCRAIVRIINDEGLHAGTGCRPKRGWRTCSACRARSCARRWRGWPRTGITEARRGAGSYVKRRPSERLGTHLPMDALAATLGTYEVRFVLEAEAARLAALRRVERAARRDRTRVGALRAALFSHAPAHDEDWNLHRAIFAAAGNAAFSAGVRHLRDSVMHILRAGVDISRSGPPQVIGAMMEEHDAIVEAIRVRDADGAALAMRWHLSQGRKRLMP